MPVGGARVGLFGSGIAIPDSVVYGFETGDVSRWDTVNDLSAVTEPYNGSYSGLCDNAQSGQPQARVVPNGYSGGLKPDKFEFYYKERSDSFGGGIRLVNSDGNIELGIATDNPNYHIDDGNGDEGLSNGEVGVWHRMTVVFDWSQGEFSVDFENLSNNNTYTDSNRPLKNGVDIEAIQIDDYTNVSTGWQGGGSIDMNFDDIGLYTTA